MHQTADREELILRMILPDYYCLNEEKKTLKCANTKIILKSYWYRLLKILKHNFELNF